MRPYEMNGAAYMTCGYSCNCTNNPAPKKRICKRIRNKQRLRRYGRKTARSAWRKVWEGFY